jgi:hypothetical protein
MFFVCIAAGALAGCICFGVLREERARNVERQLLASRREASQLRKQLDDMRYLAARWQRRADEATSEASEVRARMAMLNMGNRGGAA